MKGCLEKNLMKKPAAAMKKKKKKRSACMKMRKVMKKKVGRQKIIKRPAMHKKAWRENVWKEADSHGIAHWKANKKKENVQARARQAARNGLPYQTKWPELGDVAAAAYAAEVKSTKAMERADSAHEAADSAHEAADEAKKEAADARVMAFQNSKQIATLQNVAKTVLETLAETAARAKRNEERLNTDDRKRGYLTP
jgi:translation initiation factor 2B subunit (eIF-2B alpha/beta/delta family)